MFNQFQGVLHVKSNYNLNTDFNQSTDSTSESIVSDCSWENCPERGLKTASFNPYLPSI